MNDKIYCWRVDIGFPNHDLPQTREYFMSEIKAHDYSQALNDCGLYDAQPPKATSVDIRYSYLVRGYYGECL